MFDVILDRDGILNIDAGYTYRLEDCVLTEGAKDALLLLKSLGARFSIATGQSGIAKGMYTEADLNAFNTKLAEQFAESGITFAAVVFCPHDSAASCECRKPKTGMLKQIEEAIGPVDWSQTWGVGDKPSDAEMILSMGGRSLLVESGPHNNTTGKTYWEKNDPALAPLLLNPRNFTAHSLGDAAKIIEREIKK